MNTDEEEASACVISLMAVEGGRKEQDLVTANFSFCRQGTQSAAQIIMVKATLRNSEKVMMPDFNLGIQQVNRTKRRCHDLIHGKERHPGFSVDMISSHPE